MPERDYSYSSTTEKYRFGYQGSLKDDEIKGEGNSYSTFFRELDSRLGNWWAIDPEYKATPWESPYVSMGDNPIWYNDPFGDKNTNWFENRRTGEIKWFNTDGGADKGFGKDNWKDLGKNVLVGTHNRDLTLREPINSAKFELYLETNKNGPTATIMGNSVPANVNTNGTLKEGLYSAKSTTYKGDGAILINNGGSLPTVKGNPNPANRLNFNADGTMKHTSEQVLTEVLFHKGNFAQPRLTTSNPNVQISTGCQTGGCGPGSLPAYRAFISNTVGFKGNYYLRAPVHSLPPPIDNAIQGIPQ